jgi:hypothetical protein
VVGCEGDIVAWRHIGDHKGVVKYDNGRFCVENFYIPIFDEPSDLGEGSGILEVIGNIYENKNYNETTHTTGDN